MRVLGCLVLVMAVGCKSGGDDVETTGLAVLGNGSGDISDRLDVMGAGGDGLNNVTDLGFNPDVADELWTVNKADDSVVIYRDMGGSEQDAEHIVDPYALHFMEKVTSVAFGAPGTFATCQDGRNTYNNQGQPNDFTGPSLWSSDPDVFGTTNPAAVDELGFDLGSHLDMLHESPQCMGIAWDARPQFDSGNVYWVFDGFNGDIVRYDFGEDHGVGFDDHCDGIIERWLGTDISRKQGVVSHLVLDPDSGLLYIADTGNGRIAVLDTNTGERGNDLPSVEDAACAQVYGKPGPDHYRWRDGEISTLVDGLDDPAGIALNDGTLFVTEHGSGFVRAYDLDGTELDAASTGRAGALQGIVVDGAGDLWIVDGSADEVLHVGAQAATNARTR